MISFCLFYTIWEYPLIAGGRIFINRMSLSFCTGFMAGFLQRNLVCLIISSLLIVTPLSAFAETEKSPKVTPWLYKQLLKTEKLIVSQSYKKALQKFQAMQKKVEKGSYSEALVLRNMSSMYALQEKYPKAIKLLRQCLALEKLTHAQEQQSLLNLGQLYLATEQYAEVIPIIRPWVDSNPQHDGQIDIVLANAYAQLKKYREALPYLESAIQSAKKPVESWYQLNLAILYEMEKYANAAQVLEKLIRYFPGNKVYWSQLAVMYQQANQSVRAASIMKLAYQQGFLTTNKEILQLFNLFLSAHLPYQGAIILHQELTHNRVASTSRNWQLLANAWGQAKEYDKAIAALDTASKLHEEGALYVQLGRIYIEQEKWSLAASALNKALNKGGLKTPGNTHILLGISYFELGQLEQARQSFLKANEYSKSKKASAQWLKYIATEVAT